MNDALAIALFTIENCLKLLFVDEFSGFDYLLPFSMWFAAIQQFRFASLTGLRDPRRLSTAIQWSTLMLT
jgi:hypothetical protein